MLGAFLGSHREVHDSFVRDEKGKALISPEPYAPMHLIFDQAKKGRK